MTSEEYRRRIRHAYSVDEEEAILRAAMEILARRQAEAEARIKSQPAKKCSVQIVEDNI